MATTRTYQGIDITKHHNEKWTITGEERPVFKRFADVKRHIDALDGGAPAEPTEDLGPRPKETTKEAKQAPVEAPVQVDEPEAQDDTEEPLFNVRMTTGTPVLGNASTEEVARFLATRSAQSKGSKPLKQFEVQPLELKADAEHSKDFAHGPIAADIFAMEHVTKELLAEAKAELAQSSKSKTDKRKAVRKLTSHKPDKPRSKTKQPPVGERFADEQLVTKGGKITYGMVRHIRAETAKFFEPDAPKGKVQAYRDLAKELGLGLETVAKISRYNILEDVE